MHRRRTLFFSPCVCARSVHGVVIWRTPRDRHVRGNVDTLHWMETSLSLCLCVANPSMYCALLDTRLMIKRSRSRIQVVIDRWSLLSLDDRTTGRSTFLFFFDGVNTASASDQSKMRPSTAMELQALGEEHTLWRRSLTKQRSKASKRGVAMSRTGSLRRPS